MTSFTDIQETEPLLSTASSSNGSRAAECSSCSSNDDELVTEEQIPGAKGSGVEVFSSLLLDSVPVIMSYILQNSIQTISIFIAGRLGPDELSASACALMIAFLNVLGWCIALGGTTALDTLGSQAFTGGSRRSDLSTHFQRCLILLWLLLVPVCIFWYFIEPVMLALGQPEQLSRSVQQFLRVLILGTPGYIGFESLKKYLQCQGIMGASTVVLLAISPINIVLNIVLIHYTPLGLLGSPLALSITYWTSFLLLSLMTYWSPTHAQNGTWGTFQPRAVMDVKSCLLFLQLALPGILMVGTEWVAFEIVALAAGRLGSLPLAAQSVIMTTDQILNTIPFGIGVAASARVGNLIGSRSPSGARRAAHASALLSVLIGLLVMVTLILTRDSFGYLFTGDEDVVQLVGKVMPLVASFQVADGLAGSCGGVLRGQGRQHVGAIFNFVAYYVIALPLGIFLAFHPYTHLGLQGLWIGQVVALFLVGLGEYGMVSFGTDWREEIKKSIKRSEEETKRLEILGVL